jgi:hypothetical protein
MGGGGGGGGGTAGGTGCRGRVPVICRKKLVRRGRDVREVDSRIGKGGTASFSSTRLS